MPPKACPQLRASLSSLSSLSAELSLRLLRCVALSLGCGLHHLASLHTGMMAARGDNASNLRHGGTLDIILSISSH